MDASISNSEVRTRKALLLHPDLNSKGRAVLRSPSIDEHLEPLQLRVAADAVDATSKFNRNVIARNIILNWHYTYSIIFKLTSRFAIDRS